MVLLMCSQIILASSIHHVQPGAQRSQQHGLQLVTGMAWVHARQTCATIQQCMMSLEFSGSAAQPLGCVCK